MHVVFRESHGLEETETPTDLGQSPADLVVLSLSDSDLGALAEAWHRGGGPEGRLPGLRLANIAALKHPLSVDTYVDQTLSGAKGILIRLIGGVPYWPYGLQQIEALAREKGIALAVLPADGRTDDRLDAVSTLPVSTLRRLQHLCDTGGVVAWQAALAQMALASGLYAGPVRGAKTLPVVGGWTPEHGVTCPVLARETSKPLVLVVFYRSYLVAADLAPVEGLFTVLGAEGFSVMGLFAPSLKAPGAAEWLRRQCAHLQPAAIVNATSFSGQGAQGRSPLDAAEVPVFQVALATSREEAWAGAERGLSPADLAMHVVMPEVDGRIFAGVASFKEPQPRDPHLEFSRFVHKAHKERIRAVAKRVKAWTSLAAKPPRERRVGLLLSTYPGRDWNTAHAVGLDAIASADAILEDLRTAGYLTDGGVSPADIDTAHESWPAAEYAAALSELPAAPRCELEEAWGQHDGPMTMRAFRRGNVIIGLQPERGNPLNRGDEYHDLSRVPCHDYVGFYLWLRSQVDVIVHIGAHGTLEWLPGKSAALSGDCWPEVLTGATPVIYPFIVNDPGEAAQAKRRIGAVTLGHIPPPMAQAATPARLSRLEALLDEFSNADGLDPKRRDRLQDDIREEARALGVEDDLGLDAAGCPAEAITRIDRFVCDVKDSQFGDGLHIWGRTPPSGAHFDTAASASAERNSLIAALDGRRIDGGPSGSPWRGRMDVLPTGRNLYTVDQRSVPTRAAFAQGRKLAAEFVRRYLQDEGNWPRSLVVDLWGSATMRTAGEEFAMALDLMGVRPVWDEASERVSGIEVVPITELDRPRVDVTLRVSGLFRDVFQTLTALYAQAVRVLAARDEADDWNPYVAAAGPRVFGPAPGSFGVGMDPLIGDYSDAARKAAGEAWLAASSWAIDGADITHEPDAVRTRVSEASAFLHLQDLPETDILLASDYATHEAGFAAAQAVTGGAARLFHMDATDMEIPRSRTLAEEVARVVHGRATQPGWIAGMRRHGFRGAAEIAATLENMAAFAQLADVVQGHLFDLYFDATLGDPDVAGFIGDANPEALAAMKDRFAALHAAGLWKSRRNSILAALQAAE
ncbi:cobaltochelatase subunit CobN [uncultured Roseobacter sp.]|uniref:cobaltochelatase subunit CobN n=1 Tax=uncultured Roseobacter sp. TaxID=114847 RepID=UPI00261D4257|nr:cobaltochelatase subunit CobN [uncultured Roseobacter sp.]